MSSPIIAPKSYPCHNCGGTMTFAPNTRLLRCPYCNSEQTIPEASAVAETVGAQFVEHDYAKFLSAVTIEAAAETTVHCTHCNGCGANITLPDNATADLCPYCGSPVVIQDFVNRAIAVQGLLPFKFEREAAYNLFRAWLQSRWLAPNNLSAFATRTGGLNGIYLPYWTYDSKTTTQYVGQRGEYYYVNKKYTRNINGRETVETRTEKNLRWYPVSGTVSVDFDEVLVAASTALPAKLIDKLEPWDLTELTTYAAEFLAGYRAETYQINLPDGFKIAQTKMASPIEQAIRKDIGGDAQMITAKQTQYADITFKHILLPLWIAAYRYQNKSFRFAINARTGEVQGEYPYSWIKITAVVLGATAILGVAYYYLQLY